MSVKPIDLQVNFSQLSNVGKEQAVLKDSLLHQQSIMSQESIEKTLSMDKKVYENQKSDTNYELKDSNQSGFYNPDSDSEDKKEEDDSHLFSGTSKEQSDPFKDPQLGKLLDLKG